jgi:hypothetical protein
MVELSTQAQTQAETNHLNNLNNLARRSDIRRIVIEQTRPIMDAVASLERILQLQSIEKIVSTVQHSDSRRHYHSGLLHNQQLQQTTGSGGTGGITGGESLSSEVVDKKKYCDCCVGTLKAELVYDNKHVAPSILLS